MSKEGFEIAWTHYQGYLCRSLNQMVSGKAWMMDCLEESTQLAISDLTYLPRHHL